MLLLRSNLPAASVVLYHRSDINLQLLEYWKISLGERQAEAQRFVRYGLYAYSEGQFTEKIRKMIFRGIPVLFIPGNTGSYKQVRSLASVSLRKAISCHSPYYFDFFAVDLNKEHSALYGGILNEQTQFVHLSIKKILQLYVNVSNPPKSVILVGHSMGGMVARGLFLSPNFDRNMVRVIITLATPHKQPVLALDAHISWYYHTVNMYWDAERATNLSHVTFLSIGGGHRDMLVRSDLTYAQQADFNVLSTAMPGVWMSTDHLCSVWCKELVVVVVRALFDLVDVRERQVSSSTSVHKAAFHYHMVHRTAGKRLAGALHPPVVMFDVKGRWQESVHRQYSVQLKDGVRVTTHVMVRLLDDPKHEFLAVEAVNLSDKDWVFACRATIVVNNVRMCESGVNLSNWTHIVPSVHYKRKLLLLNMTALHHKPFTHIVLRVLPTDDPVQLNVDVHSSGRYITVTLPSMPLHSELAVLKSTDYGAVHYKIMLPGFERVWQAHRLYITPSQCKRDAHHAVVSFKAGWRHEDCHAYITENSSEVLHLRLHTPKPIGFDVSISPWVELTLDPGCTYSVRMNISVVDMLGQLVRFYSSMLLAYVAGILVLTVRHQLHSVCEYGYCVMFHSALVAGVQPLSVLPIILLCSYVLTLDALAGLVPGPDVKLLQEQGLDWPLLPLLLFAVAFILVYLLGICCWFAIIFSGHTVHKLLLRLLARTMAGSLSLSEWVLAAVNKLPAAVTCFLLTLCFTSCGAVALGIASTFCFLKLCKMYNDYLEDLFKDSIKLIVKGRKNSSAGDGDHVKECGTATESMPAMNERESLGGAGDMPEHSTERDADDDGCPLSELHFTFTLLLLLVALTTINIPCVLTWAHNFRYSATLHKDPSFLVSLVTCMCLGVHWHIPMLKPHIKHYPAMCHMLLWLAVAMFLYTPVSLYHLSPLVAAVFVVITLHQVL